MTMPKRGHTNDPNPSISDRKNAQNQRSTNRRTLLQMARDACNNQGGRASIDERFAIIDTKKFKVIER